ncbi:MAG: hypothetical protein HZA24_05930 [Nitrospirae bacterium]|nr:hypothetical protein [Nitrospirota bacterium]
MSVSLICRFGSVGSIARFALACSVLVLAGCTHGTVLVGQPQVHTRDRLVAERHQEAEWLRSKITKEELDKVGTEIAGYHDLSAFTGIYANFTAQVDPAAGALKKLQSDTDRAKAEADYWAAKKSAKDAKDVFEGNAQATPPVATAPVSVETEKYTEHNTYTTDKDGKPVLLSKETSKETVKPNPPATKENNTPDKEDEKDGDKPTGTRFGKRDDTAELPDTSVTKSLAEPTALNKLHDQLAYLDTVNATLRQVELDDSHDLAGQQLYELTMGATVVPGNHSSGYAQLELSLHALKGGDERREQLVALFDRWREALQVALLEEVRGLQRRRMAGELSKADREFLTWFVNDHLLALRHELEFRKGEIDKFTKAITGGTYQALDNAAVQAAISPDLSQVDIAGKPLGNTVITEIAQTVTVLLSSSSQITPPPSSALSDKLKNLLIAHNVDDATADNVVAHLGKTLAEQARKTRRDLAEISSRALTYGPWMTWESGDTMNTTSQIEVQQSAIAAAHTAVAALIEDVNSEPTTDIDKFSPGLVDRLIWWAVWVKYRNELAPIVDISAPKLDNNDPWAEGMEVKPFPAILFVNDAKPGDDKHLKKDQADCPTGTVAYLKGMDEDPDVFIGLKDSGLCTFIRRIMNAEEHPIAISVSPREEAQNISDVAAREQMLDLLLNVTATQSSQARTGKADLEFLNRSRERAHALTRKPQVVGFGQGRERFGWVLGPRFGVDRRGHPTFLHEAARHDVSAAIVVPGWWRYMHVEGVYTWIDRFGKPVWHKCLWGGTPHYANGRYSCKQEGDVKPYLSLHLPKPPDGMDAITRALIAPEGARNAYSVFADRRGPRIEHVTAGANNEVTANGEGAASILITGENLWRSPQVFLGGVEANNVKVLSHMEAVLATFERLAYPGTPAQANAGEAIQLPLTVLTAFGQDREDNAVTVHPAKKQEPNPPAPTQATRYVVGKTGVVTFTLPGAAKTPGPLNLMMRTPGSKSWPDRFTADIGTAGSVTVDGLLEPTSVVGDKVDFSLNASKEATGVVEVNLARRIGNWQPLSEGKPLLEKPAKLAFFASEAARGGALHGLSSGKATLTFAKDAKLDESMKEVTGFLAGTLVTGFDGGNADAFAVAYQGWSETFSAQGSHMGTVTLSDDATNTTRATLSAECTLNGTTYACKADIQSTADKKKLWDLMTNGFTNLRVKLTLAGKGGDILPVAGILEIKQAS